MHCENSIAFKKGYLFNSDFKMVWRDNGQEGNCSEGKTIGKEQWARELLLQSTWSQPRTGLP
jgi:hypothetical protein